MKKGFLITLTILVLFTLSGCKHSMVSTDSGLGNEFRVYTAIEIENAKYEISSQVPVILSYGHDNSSIPGETEYDDIKNIEINILLYGEKKDGLDSLYETTILYTEEFQASEFIIDEYRCSLSYGFFSGTKVDFSHKFTFDVDFSNFDYEGGKVAISITITVPCENCENDNKIQKLSQEAYLNFEIKDGEIKFE